MIAFEIHTHFNPPLKFVLHILNKHLTNERAWLRKEGYAAIDRKYAEGARMAKERIPQLEQAIKIILRSTVDSPQTTVKRTTTVKQNSQLSIFN